MRQCILRDDSSQTIPVGAVGDDDVKSVSLGNTKVTSDTCPVQVCFQNARL